MNNGFIWGHGVDKHVNYTGQLPGWAPFPSSLALVIWLWCKIIWSKKNHTYQPASLDIWHDSHQSTCSSAWRLMSWKTSPGHLNRSAQGMQWDCNFLDKMCVIPCIWTWSGRCWHWGQCCWNMDLTWHAEQGSNYCQSGRCTWWIPWNDKEDQLCRMTSQEMALTVTLATPSVPNIMSWPRIMPHSVMVSCLLCVCKQVNLACSFLCAGVGSVDVGESVSMTWPLGLMLNTSSLSTTVSWGSAQVFMDWLVGWASQACWRQSQN